MKLENSNTSINFIRSRDINGSKNSISRSHDLFQPPLTFEFCIFSLVPLVIKTLIRAKFEVSSFTRFGDMDRVPKFQK